MAKVLLRGLSMSRRHGAGVDLELADGEVLALLGAAALPLRTLLRGLAGLEPIVGGDLLIDGRDVTEVRAAARGVGLVVAGGALFPHLDVRGNLDLGLRLRGGPRAAIEARVNEIASLIGFETRLGQQPQALSAADRIRVAAGRALARSPALVLIDDALAGLEPGARATLRGDLAALARKTRTTLLLATTEPEEAFHFGDRVAVFKGDRLAQVASPQELLLAPATAGVARVLGPRAMNVLEFGVADGHIAFGATRVPVPGSGPAIRVAVRPEELFLEESPDRDLSLAGTVVRVDVVARDPFALVVAGTQRLVVRCEPAWVPAAGASVVVTCASRNLRYFEANESGQRLTWPPPPLEAPAASSPPAPPPPEADSAVA